MISISKVTVLNMCLQINFFTCPHCVGGNTVKKTSNIWQHFSTFIEPLKSSNENSEKEITESFQKNKHGKPVEMSKSDERCH